MVVDSNLRLLGWAACLHFVFEARFADIEDVGRLVNDKLMTLTGTHHCRVLMRVCISDHLGGQRPTHASLSRICHAARHHSLHGIDRVVARWHRWKLLIFAHTLLSLWINAATILMSGAACQLCDGLLLEQTGLNLSKLSLVVQVKELLYWLHHFYVVIQPRWSQHSCSIPG